jgi:hypothetical protein
MMLGVMFKVAFPPPSEHWKVALPGEPKSVFTDYENMCQEKLSQQFSPPKDGFLFWGRSPCATASRQTKRGYYPLRGDEIAQRRDCLRSDYFCKEMICEEGSSRALRGAPQAKRGVQQRWSVQRQALNNRRATSSGGEALFMHPLLGILRLVKANFNNKKCCLALLRGIAIEHCTYKYIGTNNGN